jgi:hypothetical protein
MSTPATAVRSAAAPARRPHPFRSPPMCRTAALVLLAVAAGCAPAGPAASREASEGAFVVLLGRDTVAVEEFRRTPTTLEGRQLVRTPRTSVRTYTATLAADGALTTFGMTAEEPGTGAPESRTEITFRNDSAHVQVVQGAETRSFRVAAPAGSIPFVAYLLAPYEQVIATRGATTAPVMVQLGPGAPLPLEVRRQSAERWIVRNVAGENRVRTDRAGRLQAWDGRGTTLQLTAERLARVPFEAMRADFQAREAAGGGLGALSPRDSVRAQVGGATIVISYGRPHKRGREIFGELVPFDDVWRTGANLATHLRTTRDLVIGDTDVPAGTYSVFTIPGRERWTLILNRQTGQWGTGYDPALDLARIGMERRTLAETVEQFTIVIEPRDGEGVLRMAWDRTEAFVPFRVVGAR